jgi:3-oxo-5alpha-steroid 4-dehydrogenase
MNNKVAHSDYSDDTPIDWYQEADVVVIGAGAAGICAALEAHERGAKVLLIDRFEGGGASGYSGGVIYLGGGTEQQREAGYQDSPDNMFNFLEKEVGDAVTPETLRRFCDQSAGNLKWLESHGVTFSGEHYSGKISYPPEGKFLYFSGNEKVESYTKIATPAPRGHRVCGKGWTGNVLMTTLIKSVNNSGIGKLWHARACRLVTDNDNKVIGVELCKLPDEMSDKHMAFYRKVNPLQPFNNTKAQKAIADCFKFEESNGKRVFVKANRGVILTTGGFVNNDRMIEQYLPGYAAFTQHMLRLGSLGCDGSGIQMAESIGAALGKMDRKSVGRSISPPNKLLEGIIVNTQGERFVNENAYSCILGESIGDQPNGKAWLIVKGETFWQAVKKSFRLDGSFKIFYLPFLLNAFFGGTKRARSIEKLAGKCGIDARNLVREIELYNKALSTGEPDRLDKLQDYCLPLEGKSLYAINLSLDNKFSFTMLFTLGGLKVDEQTGQVIDIQGDAIEGLYAAGRAAVGVCGNSYYASGGSLSDCVFSGRRAGRCSVESCR